MAIWRVGAQGQFTDPPTREDKLLTTVVIVGMVFVYGAVLSGVVFQPTTTPFSQATSLVGLLAGGYAAAYLVHADHRWYVQRREPTSLFFAHIFNSNEE